MIEITTLEELNAILASNTYVFLDFFAPYCLPCEVMEPYVLELELQYPLVTFVKVNCSVTTDIANKYQVGAVPTFMLFSSAVNVATIYGTDKEGLSNAMKENFS